MLRADLDQRRQVLEVHLVDDAGAGRHGAEVLERALGELEQLVPLTIAVVLQRDVERERALAAEVIHLHRVVDHQVAGHQRIDPVGIALHAHDGIAHRRQVDHARHAGEVLQHHAGRHERNLAPGGVDRLPAHDVADNLFRYDSVPRKAQRILQQDPDGEGQPVEPAQALLLQFRQAVDDRLLAIDSDGAA